eukprot:TRINITY_DN727_c0_g5_i1.p1 TRINITY_DN727_c0_g5~~TRINITY_DN727_c0_g5_i1.p1  ORF type:complete len:577 (-),score=141.07 TRINITY_DN727_c0_g5_i1:297-2027(-)
MEQGKMIPSSFEGEGPLGDKNGGRLGDGQLERTVKAAAAAGGGGKSQTSSASRPKRFIRQQVPSEITEDPNLRAACAVLPSNYNLEIPKTIWRIKQEKAKCVALQFPEGLLMFACVIADILEQFAGVEHCIVLGDVAYGACCIDDVGAASMGVEFLVHYGHSCLVPVDSSLIPCLYVFVEIAIDVNHLLTTIRRNIRKDTRLIVAGTVQFLAAVQAVKLELGAEFVEVIVPQAKPLSSGEVLGCTAPVVALPPIDAQLGQGGGGRGGFKTEEANGDGSSLKGVEQSDGSGEGEFSAKEGALTRAMVGGKGSSILLFVADGRFHLEAMMIANPALPTFRYDPYTRLMSREHYDHLGMRRARHAAIKRAGQARRWALVHGMLGRQGNLRTVEQLRARILQRGLECVTLLVSELSPEKVALFHDSIDAIVQVSCPRLSIDWGEAFQLPLLTPYEAHVALGIVPPWWEEGSAATYRSKPTTGYTPSASSSSSRSPTFCLTAVSQPVKLPNAAAAFTSTFGSLSGSSLEGEEGEAGAGVPLMNRNYPMDFYSASGQPWTATHSLRAASRPRRRVKEREGMT